MGLTRDQRIRKEEHGRKRLEARYKAGMCAKCRNRRKGKTHLCKQHLARIRVKSKRTYLQRKLMSGVTCIRGMHPNDQPEKSTQCTACTIDRRVISNAAYARRQRRLRRKLFPILVWLFSVGAPLEQRPEKEPPPHGTYSRYVGTKRRKGCRCRLCTDAAAAYMKDRRTRLRARRRSETVGVPVSCVLR